MKEIKQDKMTNSDWVAVVFCMDDWQPSLIKIFKKKPNGSRWGDLKTEQFMKLEK